MGGRTPRGVQIVPPDDICLGQPSSPAGSLGQMERVYVVTHAEATHHVEDLIGGWYDSELTQRGHRRAAEIAAYLRDVVPARSNPRVIASDLTRTRQTAEPIATALKAPLVLDPDLREHSLGVAGGKPKSFLDGVPVKHLSDGSRVRDLETIQGAETMAHCVGRVYRAVARMMAVGDASGPDNRPRGNSSTVVVTHGGTAGFVIAAWLGVPIEACARARFCTPTGSVSILERDDTFHNRTLTRLGIIEL